MIATDPNAADVARLNGGCSGSVSRVTSADTIRCTENWCDCSWSFLVAMSTTPAADDGVQTEYRARERDQRQRHQYFEDLGVPAEVRAREFAAVPQAAEDR